MNQTLQDAYNREKKLLPVILDMERRGVRISEKIVNVRLQCLEEFDEIDASISSKLGKGSEDIKLGSKKMFSRLEELGLVDHDKITYTDKGNPRYGRAFLPDIITDEKLADYLILRGKLQKVIGTYINPWHKSFVEHRGYFFPYYNQVRSVDNMGTRTGRLSSNLQQIPKKPTDVSIPNMRKFIVPDAGQVLLQRDFSAQEVRIAAHYAEGTLLEAFIENPALDAHAFVKDIMVDNTGMEIERNLVKTINFLKLYGGGPKLLAERFGLTVSQARVFFNAYDKALPELKQLDKDVQNMARNQPIRTWGGRLYEVEVANISGRLRALYYKMINVLIQGSAADMTKEAMIRYYYHPDRHADARIMLSVHDELVVSCPGNCYIDQMQLLKHCMDDIEGWDVPLLSDGAIGENFGELEEWED